MAWCLVKHGDNFNFALSLNMKNYTHVKTSCLPRMLTPEKKRCHFKSYNNNLDLFKQYVNTLFYRVMKGDKIQIYHWDLESKQNMSRNLLTITRVY